MNDRDLLFLTGHPLQPRPAAIKEAAHKLKERDREALRKAEEKRERKRAKALAASR